MTDSFKVDRKTVERWFESRGAELSADMYENGKELGTWLPSWIDHLTFLLTGKEVSSVTKRDAIRALRPSFEKFMKKKFPLEVPNQTPLAGAYREVVPNNQPGEKPVNTQEVTSTKKVSLTKSKVAAKGGKTEKGGKTAKAAKSIETTKRGRAGKFADDAKIVVLTKDNPKREGTKAHENFALYSKNKTVGAFLAAGGSRADLAWDVAAGFIEIK